MWWSLFSVFKTLSQNPLLLSDPLPFPVLNSWDELEELTKLNTSEIAIMRDKTRRFLSKLEEHIENELKRKVTRRIDKYFAMMREKPQTL